MSIQLCANAITSTLVRGMFASDLSVDNTASGLKFSTGYKITANQRLLIVTEGSPQK